HGLAWFSPFLRADWVKRSGQSWCRAFPRRRQLHLISMAPYPDDKSSGLLQILVEENLGPRARDDLGPRLIQRRLPNIGTDAEVLGSCPDCSRTDAVLHCQSCAYPRLSAGMTSLKSILI